jgi:two-component system, NtrC family, response regulator GlrR
MSERPIPEMTQSIQAPLPKDSRVRLHEWSLEVASGPDKGKKVKTLDALVSVGADPTNDLVLVDPTVSRRHLEVERAAGGFVVRDLGSRNGSFLDGRQIIQAYLQPGDRVTVGKTRVVLKQEAAATEVEVSGADRFGELIGASEKMRAVFAVLRKAAAGDMNVLIEGETGTGKEVAARAIHAHSDRRHGPFKVIDCYLLREETAERELFGEGQGSAGAFEAAVGGMVFLDEVGDLPLALQPKLLRVLDARESDVRVIASTQRNLAEEVRQERFRKDLYFRLAVAQIRLPPLRTRREDIPLLAEHLLSRLGTAFEITPQTLNLFESYDWPGNVRELRNVLERGALMQETGTSNWLDFLATPSSKKGEPSRSVGSMVVDLLYHDAKDRVLAEFERFYFAEVMKRANFDMKIAEQKTGLSMQSLYRLLKKNGLRLKELKNTDGLEK